MAPKMIGYSRKGIYKKGLKAKVTNIQQKQSIDIINVLLLLLLIIVLILVVMV